MNAEHALWVWRFEQMLREHGWKYLQPKLFGAGDRVSMQWTKGARRIEVQFERELFKVIKHTAGPRTRTEVAILAPEDLLRVWVWMMDAPPA